VDIVSYPRDQAGEGERRRREGEERCGEGGGGSLRERLFQVRRGKDFQDRGGGGDVDSMDPISGESSSVLFVTNLEMCSTEKPAR
jgi:hypothetical protein